MADYDNKEVPSQLRGQSSIARAEAHRDGFGRAAEASSSRSQFRSQAAVSKGDEDFAAFLNSSNGDPRAQSSSQISSGSVSDAAIIAARTWAEDDLYPKRDDGAAVLDMLEQIGQGDLDDELRDLVNSQSQPWRMAAENAVPARNLPDTAIASGYLLSALASATDGASLATYLRSHSYSDDVWGLPSSLIEDLDTIKDNTASQQAQDKAIGRLQMLKRHMLGGGSADTVPSQSLMTSDWDKIWNAG